MITFTGLRLWFLVRGCQLSVHNLQLTGYSSQQMNSFGAENLSVTQTIQLILAPGVMINACGLLLLGIGNKFSSVLNRIRILNDEKRRLHMRAGDRIIRLRRTSGLKASCGSSTGCSSVHNGSGMLFHVIL